MPGLPARIHLHSIWVLQADGGREMESVLTAEETGNDGSTSDCLQPDDEDSGVYGKEIKCRSLMFLQEIKTQVQASAKHIQILGYGINAGYIKYTGGRADK